MQTCAISVTWGDWRRTLQGKEGAAEAEWNYACDRISVGCSKYQDKDWLSRIRRCAGRHVRPFGHTASVAAFHSLVRMMSEDWAEMLSQRPTADGRPRWWSAWTPSSPWPL
jgi:hypothetical protein